jgi:hypothetical protein
MSGTLCIPVLPNAILLNPVAVVDVVIAVNYAMACRGQQGCHFLKVPRAAVIRRVSRCCWLSLWQQTKSLLEKALAVHVEMWYSLAGAHCCPYPLERTVDECIEQRLHAPAAKMEG